MGHVDVSPAQRQAQAGAPKSKDLSGWVPVYEITFAVTNGNLRLVDGKGWLRTERQFADFVLKAARTGLR